MKYSLYNSLIPITADNAILYNALSDKFLVVNKDYAVLLQSPPGDIEQCHKSFYSNLTKDSFCVEDDFRETEFAIERGVERCTTKEIREINLNNWREKWGVVMQDGRIFSGTVAENIALADETPDFERLAYACKVACIYDKIMSMPMRFNTRIGETGMDLSGGEKQRVLVARAVYRNPEYLLFDEATSSLDAATERKIMENLFEFYEGRTVVVIAHRLSTVKNADNIIFMENGRVAEQGTHEELLDLRGSYYTLVGNQLEMSNCCE